MVDEDRLIRVFERVEATLKQVGDLPEDSREMYGISYGQRVLPVRTGQEFDNEYYLAMCFVVFFSGFRSEVVLKKAGRINHYFGQVEAAARMKPADIEALLMDTTMIRNRRKVEACVHNAREFLRVRDSHGSFGGLLLGHGRPDTINGEALETLRNLLMTGFRYMGPATVNHFLLDYGYPVLKPDRMVMRVLHRTGLIPGTEERHYPQASEHCRTIAVRLGLSTRYVDWVLVGLGMEGRAGLCRKNDPACGRCLVDDLCGFGK